MSQLDNFDVVFDPVLGRPRAEGKRPETVVGGGSSSGGGTVVVGGAAIPQYDSDPASPTAEDAWVLKSGAASGGGEIKAFLGAGMPFPTAGTSTVQYQFSYYTKEGTIKRVSLT